MRCRECNVDLPKEYTSCPLCGGKVSDDKPLIEGITLAEYPKVKTEPYKRNLFPVFLIIWALTALAGIILYKTAIISENIFAFVISIVPAVWTLIFRPLFVRQLYAGNYVMMNLYPALFGGFVFCLLKSKLDYFFTCFFPIVIVAMLVALTVIIFLQPKVCKRASPYAVLTGTLSVIMSIIFAFIQKSVPFAWLGVLVICIGILVILFCKSPKETKEELKAKFSIQ